MLRMARIQPGTHRFEFIYFDRRTYHRSHVWWWYNSRDRGFQLSWYKDPSRALVVGAFYLAGDLADISIKKTTFNFEHTHTRYTGPFSTTSISHCSLDVVKWDARQLPFHENSIDV